jgi:hypothetical protein
LTILIILGKDYKLLRASEHTHLIKIYFP